MTETPFNTASEIARALEDPAMRSALALARERDRLLGPVFTRSAAEEALGLTASAIARGLPKTAPAALSATRLAAGEVDPITTAMRDAEARLPPGVIETMRKAQEHFALIAGATPVGAGADAFAAATVALDAYRSPARDVLDEIAGKRRALPSPDRGERIADRVIPAQGRSRGKSKAADASQAVAPGTAISSTADIGRCIRSARRAMGMNQQRFADLAGVGRRFLGELERGKASLEIGRVLAVCEAAGIKLGFVA